MTSTRRQRLNELNDPLEANGMDELTNEPASPSLPAENIFLFIPNLIGTSRSQFHGDGLKCIDTI